MWEDTKCVQIADPGKLAWRLHTEAMAKPEVRSGQQAGTGAKDKGESTEPESSGMTWPQVAERLVRLMKQGEPWTSQRKMAEQIGCSLWAINKAIKETPDLHKWTNARSAQEADPRAQSITEVVTDRTSQSRELDPTDDLAIREFMEKADPETRAWFQALSTENQLAYLNDPDKHDKILGRKP
jgi:hypothetical protein